MIVNIRVKNITKKGKKIKNFKVYAYMFYLQNLFMCMYIYEDITLTWTFSAKVLKKLT